MDLEINNYLINRKFDLLEEQKKYWLWTVEWFCIYAKLDELDLINNLC